MGLPLTHEEWVHVTRICTEPLSKTTINTTPFFYSQLSLWVCANESADSVAATQCPKRGGNYHTTTSLPSSNPHQTLSLKPSHTLQPSLSFLCLCRFYTHIMTYRLTLKFDCEKWCYKRERTLMFCYSNNQSTYHQHQFCPYLFG